MEAEELQYHLLTSLGGLQEATDVRATFQSLTVSPSVPEPSTWALMLLGFVGLGFMRYRVVAARP